MDAKQIILIGGAPTTGKSTMAQLVSKKLEISWISTDQVREILKGVFTKEERPMLFNSRSYSAEEFLTKFTADEIVDIENQENKIVWDATQAFITEQWSWDSYVVEGVAIVPHLVHASFPNRTDVKTVFLIDEDEDRIRDVVWNRGLWDDAHAYPDSVKEKEVEWVLKYNKFLIAEAAKYGYPTVEVSKGVDDVNAVLTKLGIL